MFTVMLGLGLTVSVIASENQSGWQHDYAAALATSSQLDRPVFVLLCDGSSQHGRMTGQTTFVSDRVERVLEAAYVRLFIDTETDAGRELARRFDAERGPRCIILDRSGKWQVYYQSRFPSESELATAVTQFRTAKLGADGRPVRPEVPARIETTTTQTASASLVNRSDPTPQVIAVGETSFDREVIQRSFERPVVVDFWAEWCGPCRSLAPVLEKAVTEDAGKPILAKINIDYAASLARRYNVEAIPTVKVFRNGQPVQGFVGVLSADQVRQFLASSQRPTGTEAVVESSNGPEVQDSIRR